ncbi:MAG TPA: DUF6691 family protein [Polyangiaceae bacterium]|nr:DUF6691 family protein [Polyangiaceae bacterium]
MKALLSALGSGLLFGVGLCISGMTDPANIIAFLDVRGRWSPNLAGVMLGAIAVHFSWLRLAARRVQACGDDARVSTKRVDGALVGGAAIFGVGWGLAGYCPGPAIVALGSGAFGAVVFVLAMAAGMLLSEGIQWTIKRSGKASLVVR